MHFGSFFRINASGGKRTVFFPQLSICGGNIVNPVVQRPFAIAEICQILVRIGQSGEQHFFQFTRLKGKSHHFELIYGKLFFHIKNAGCVIKIKDSIRAFSRSGSVFPAGRNEIIERLFHIIGPVPANKQNTRFIRLVRSVSLQRTEVGGQQQAYDQNQKKGSYSPVFHKITSILQPIRVCCVLFHLFVFPFVKPVYRIPFHMS